MPFTEEQEDLIARKYQEGGSTLREIARGLNSHHQLVGDVLRKKGIPIRQERGTRTHLFDQSTFACVDTPEKAYYFGFLLADGVVDEKRGRLLVELQKRDAEILEGLKALLQADHDLRDMGEDRGSYRLSIQSRRMISDLAEKGCGQNKHDKVIFPEWLEEGLCPSFLRGYLDGDGSVFLRPQRNRPSPYLEVSFSGTERFLIRVQEILTKIVGEPAGNIYRVSRRGETRVLRIRREQHVVGVLQFLYSEEGPRLERKWRTAQQILTIRSKGKRQ